MLPNLQKLLDEIRDLEERVRDEISREAEQFGYTVRQGRISFEQDIVRQHAALKQRIGRYLAESSLLFILSAPLVYSLIVPLVALDIIVWVYQTACFPIYKIPKVRRSEYVVIDRHRLRYLNLIERTHCAYCGYANGLVSYVREVAARTEQYWCPIKHARSARGHHDRYYTFAAYGDGDHYAAELQRLRRLLEAEINRS